MMPMDGMPSPSPEMPPMPMGSTAPAAGRPDMGGMQMRGTIMARLGMKALEQALSLAGADTEPGKAILKALSSLASAFPSEPNADLTAQEVKLLTARANPAPTSPVQAAGDALSRMNFGGSAPTAAPAAA